MIIFALCIGFCLGVIISLFLLVVTPLSFQLDKIMSNQDAVLESLALSDAKLDAALNSLDAVHADIAGLNQKIADLIAAGSDVPQEIVDAVAALNAKAGAVADKADAVDAETV